jgi:pyridoxine 5-phosphate synthase
LIRLGVNIDHIATLRQARGEAYPDPVQAAIFCELGGAKNITCHLREDRRHIQDRDLELLKQTIKIPLNFEMAATAEMVQIACKIRPEAVTLVPEKRAELTTEGGLDIKKSRAALKGMVSKIHSEAGSTVSIFIDNSREMVDLSKEIGAEAIEIHTGDFCRAMDRAKNSKEQQRLMVPLFDVAGYAANLDLQVHYGHGLHYGNAHWLQLIDQAEEANIGHSIIARAILVGLQQAVFDMNALLNDPKYKPKAF